MTGTVYWPQLIMIVGAIITVTLAVSGFACWILIMAWRELGELKTTVLAKLDTDLAALENRLGSDLAAVERELGSDIAAVDNRLRALEAERLLITQARLDAGEFRQEVRNEFRTLRHERAEDMKGLHARLNDLLMLPIPSTPAGP